MGWLIAALLLLLIQGGLTALLRRAKGLPKDLCHGHFRLQIRENRGFAFGKLRSRPQAVRRVTLLCAVFGTICLLPFLFAKPVSRLGKLAATLLLAGCWGNTAERLIRGAVTDYLSLPKAWGRMKRIVFDAADLFLVLGAVFAVLATLFRHDA